MRRRGDEISSSDKISNGTTGAHSAGFKLQECVQENLAGPVGAKPSVKPIQSRELERHAHSQHIPDTAVISSSSGQKSGPMNVPDFCGAIRKNLRRLDKNGDFRISQSELDQAMLDPAFKGKDAQMLATLKGSFHDLHKLGSSKWFQLGGLFKEKTIGLREIQKLNDLYQTLRVEATNIWQAKEFGARCFMKLDADKDDFISKAELDTAIKAGCLSLNDKQSALYLRSKFDTFKGASNPSLRFAVSGISRQDFAQVDSYLYSYSFDWMLASHLLGRLQEFGNEISNHKSSLYGDATNPLKSIKPEVVRQGEVGDCYFMAAVASLAQSSPRTILEMIKDNHNGTCKVTFPGHPDKPLTVSKPTHQELALYAKGGKEGTWAAVLEKAFGAYLNNQPGLKGKKVIPAEATDGGSPAEALKILTGKQVDTCITWFTLEDKVANMLEHAVKHNKPVVLTTPHTLSSLAGVGDARNLAGLRSGHAFSVIGYDANTKIVTIRDPGGNGDPVGSGGQAVDGVNDGKFTMTVDELKSTFLEIVVVQD